MAGRNYCRVLKYLLLVSRTRFWPSTRGVVCVDDGTKVCQVDIIDTRSKAYVSIDIIPG